MRILLYALAILAVLTAIGFAWDRLFVQLEKSDYKSQAEVLEQFGGYYHD